jgi:hypothetical protein
VDLVPANSGMGNVNHVGAVNAFQGVDAGQEFGGGSYVPIAMYGDSPEMFDENFFPIGFFDVTNAGPWQWQPGTM